MNLTATNRSSLSERAVLVVGVDPDRLSSLASRVDAVLASGATAELLQHDKVRDSAERGFKRAVDQFVDDCQGNARRRRKKADEMNALFLVLMEEECEHAYEAAYERLERLNPPRMGRRPSPRVLKQEAQAHAVERSKYLHNFPATVQQSFADAMAAATKAAAKDRAVADALSKVAKDAKAGPGAVVALTEAQASYGSAQIRVLQRAGFTMKAWVTMDDERVRESHSLCESQGAIPMDKVFHNGLRFPGDPNGGPADTINCRCWLVGAGRPR